MKIVVKKSDYAKVDPAFFVDGLFVPIADKDKAINIVHDWDGGTIEFRGVQLGAAHQSVLLAICARVGRNGELIVKDDFRHFNGISLLKVGDDAQTEPLAIVEVNAANLLTDAGLGRSGANYKQLSWYLTDLQTLVVHRKMKGSNRGANSNVISSEYKDDNFKISLNWRLANAILGEDGGGFIQVSLHERFKMKSPVAKVLHAWLSSNIRPGKALGYGGGVMIDSLMSHVWGESQASKQSVSNKRVRLKEAIKEVGSLGGWSCVKDDDVKNKYHISRPKNIK